MQTEQPKVIIYNYDKKGEFIDSSVANMNPLKPDEPLLPAGSTLKAPPPKQQNEVNIFKEGEWYTLPDLRGPIYSKDDGTESIQTEPGQLAPGWTTKPRPSNEHVFNDKKGLWVLDEKLVQEKAIFELNQKTEQKKLEPISYLDAEFSTSPASTNQILIFLNSDHQELNILDIEFNEHRLTREQVQELINKMHIRNQKIHKNFMNKKKKLEA